MRRLLRMRVVHESFGARTTCLSLCWYLSHNNSPNALPLAGQLVMFFTGVISASVIIAYLRLKSGSLWSAAVFHASHNLFIQRIFNPLTIDYPNSAKYVDELGLVLPLIMVPVAVYFFVKGRREFG